MVKNRIIDAFVTAWGNLTFNPTAEREMLWAISNLLTYNGYVSDTIKEQDFIFVKISNALHSSDSILYREALHCISNLIKCSDFYSLMNFMFTKGLFYGLIQMLDDSKQYTLGIVLHALRIIKECLSLERAA